MYNINELYVVVIRYMEHYHYEGYSCLLGPDTKLSICNFDKDCNYGYDITDNDKKYTVKKLTGNTADIIRCRKAQHQDVIDVRVPLTNVLKQYKILFNKEDITVEDAKVLKSKIEEYYSKIK